MNKEDLLDKIREFIRTEEKAVTVYSEHLSAIVSRSGLSQQKIKSVKDNFELLIKANRTHKDKLESLINKINLEKANDF